MPSHNALDTLATVATAPYPPLPRPPLPYSPLPVSGVRSVSKAGKARRLHQPAAVRYPGGYLDFGNRFKRPSVTRDRLAKSHTRAIDAYTGLSTLLASPVRDPARATQLNNDLVQHLVVHFMQRMAIGTHVPASIQQMALNFIRVLLNCWPAARAIVSDNPPPITFASAQELVATDANYILSELASAVPTPFDPASRPAVYTFFQ